MADLKPPSSFYPFCLGKHTTISKTLLFREALIEPPIFTVKFFAIVRPKPVVLRERDKSVV